MTTMFGTRLRGKTIFLSASVPDPERDPRFRQIEDAPFQIEQAVISLARAVFSEGGQLVFGGHPSISPLVSIVAGEYRAPVLAESREERPPPSVLIYQSEIFREFVPRDTELLIDLGLAKEHWVQADPEESFIPGKGPAAKQCPHSLRAMRERMIEDTRPIAMVCIGGMEGVIHEVEQFEGRGPVYVLARTGGAAAIIAEDFGNAIAIDEEIMGLLSEGRRPESGAEEGVPFYQREKEGDIKVMPYPLIMQTIVDRLTQRYDGGLGLRS